MHKISGIALIFSLPLLIFLGGCRGNDLMIEGGTQEVIDHIRPKYDSNVRLIENRYPVDDGFIYIINAVSGSGVSYIDLYVYGCGSAVDCALLSVVYKITEVESEDIFVHSDENFIKANIYGILHLKYRK